MPASEQGLDGRLRQILGPMWGEVFAWLGQRGIEPAGPPLIRYNVIDVDR